MDIEESFVPQEIKDNMDSELNVDDELFDASNALSVEGIDFNAIMEGLSIVSIFIETYGERKNE